MRIMKYMKKSVLLFTFACVMLVFTGCKASNDSTLDSLSDLNKTGIKIGVSVSTPEEAMLKEDFPDAEIIPYSDFVIGYEDVSNGKIDAFVDGRTYIQKAIDNGLDGVKLLDEDYSLDKSAVGISDVSKIPDLEDNLNKFIASIKSDGTYEDMYERWIVNESDKMPDIDVPSDSDIKLKVGTTGLVPPYSYYVDEEISGFDIELAKRFAAYMGYSLEFKIYDFNGVVAAMQGGDVDLVMSNLYYTEERAESITFSDPINETPVAVLVGDGSDKEASQESGPEYTTFDELNGKTISMLTGAPFEELISTKVSDVGQFTYFTTMADMVMALKEGKTDAIFMNNAVANLAVNRDPELSIFPESVDTSVFGVAFDKGDTQKDIWQEAFESLSSEDIDAAWEKWTGADDDAKILPEQDWEGANGTVTVAACDSLEPMSYIGGDNELMGLDEEIVLMMAKELDVHVEFVGMEFSAVMSYVQSGKALMGVGSIIVTDERKEACDFIEYYPASFELAVRTSGDASASGGFLDSVCDSFRKTFIRENRWKLFVQGIETTLLITVLSIIFGTVLGFVVFLFCRRGNKVANGIAGAFIWIIQGMPVVVLLMILYYIIFGSVEISGTLVSVAGFTLIFAAAVFKMIKLGIASVDIGQQEAAYALGLSEKASFFKIILPQAMPLMMPQYIAQISALIKATAIVGYIAVQDVTKMGDIIRSRTYDAFFPLIAVAIVYYILAALLIFIVRCIEKRAFACRSRG